MKLLSLFFSMIILSATVAFGQTLEELKAEQAAKKDTLNRLKTELNALESQINTFPGWKLGAFGTLGVNLTNFNNWFSKGIPNSSGGNIGFTSNFFANLDREKFFWRNSAAVNLGWVKFDDKDDPDDKDEFEQATDVFNISSLYGYKISEKFAISSLMEYRTTLLSNFNDPGYLDLGVGGTWTPVKNLIVVVHPLNYNIVFADSEAIFESSLGAKIVVDYTRKLPVGIDFKTNLSTFQSYKTQDLSNWTWTNSFGYTIWKAIGVGFEFGLRENKQETLDYVVNTLGDTEATFDTIDNELQSYWILGINYTF